MNQAIIPTKEGEKMLLVAVPKEATDFRISKTGLVYYIPGYSNGIKLYEVPNSSEIIGLASEISEEQAKGLVTYMDDLFDHFGDVFRAGKNPKWYNTAKEAISGLIESSGLILTDKEDVLVIKIN